MSRIKCAGIKCAGAMALVMAIGGWQARAAAPALPPDSVAPNTLAVIHMDAAHFNPDALRTAAKAVLGENADRANDAIAKFQEKYDKAANAGVQAMTIVMTRQSKKAADDAGAGSGPGAGPGPGAAARQNQPDTVVYWQLKPGADIKAVKAAATADMPPADRNNAVFEEQGRFLAMHEKNKPLPTGHDAALARTFSDALGTIGDASVQIAVIFDAEAKAEMLKDAQKPDAPKGMKDAAPLLANSKWVTIAVNFGNAPGITATANTADAGSAKQLSDDINTALDDMKQQANNPNGGGAAAMFAPLIASLADGLKPTQTGSQVSVGIKGQSLNMIAGIAMQFMGGPGGPGGAPRRSPGAPRPPADQ